LPLSDQLLGVSYVVPETGSRQTILICSQRTFRFPAISRLDKRLCPIISVGVFSKSSPLVSDSLIFIGGEIRKNGPDWQKNLINAAEGTGLLQK